MGIKVFKILIRYDNIESTIFVFKIKAFNPLAPGRLLTALSIFPRSAFIFKCHFPMAIDYGLELTK